MKPGVFGDDVGDDEVDFGEFVGDGASVDAAVGIDAVDAGLHLGGGFDLDADQARAEAGVEVGGERAEVGRVAAMAVEDDVVAFAVAEGFGDAEAVAGGGEGEGEFGDLAAAFGGEFALEGSERLGSLWGAGWSGRGFRATLGASANGAFSHFGRLGLRAKSRFLTGLSARFRVIRFIKESDPIRMAQGRKGLCAKIYSLFPE